MRRRRSREEADKGLRKSNKRSGKRQTVGLGTSYRRVQEGRGKMTIGKESD